MIITNQKLGKFKKGSKTKKNSTNTSKTNLLFGLLNLKSKMMIKMIIKEALKNIKTKKLFIIYHNK
jgi:hypothetical protein